MSFMLSDEQAARARVLLAELTTLFGSEPKVPPAPQAAPPAPVAGKPATLTPQDISDAAAALACDVPAIYAVRDVESNGHGFAADGRPIILFEPHVFSRLTQRRFDDTHGGVSYQKWGAKPYPKTQAERWAQLEYAANLDSAAAAAYQSASYGLFQIMGFNFAACGYTGVLDFFAKMHLNEREHLMAFIRFVQSKGLAEPLRAHRWADFAKGYNGAGYAANHYDTKLAAAYRQHGGI